MDIKLILHSIKNNKQLTEAMIKSIESLSHDDKMKIIKAYDRSLVALTRLRCFFVWEVGDPLDLIV